MAEIFEFSCVSFISPVFFGAPASGELMEKFSLLIARRRAYKAYLAIENPPQFFRTVELKKYLRDADRNAQMLRISKIPSEILINAIYESNITDRRKRASLVEIISSCLLFFLFSPSRAHVMSTL